MNQGNVSYAEEFRSAMEEYLEQQKTGSVHDADEPAKKPQEESQGEENPTQDTLKADVSVDNEESGDEVANSEKPEQDTTQSKKKMPSYITGEYMKSYHEWPEEAKEYIARREKDINEGFSKHDEFREIGRRAKNTFSKYNEYLSELGVKDPLQVIEPLLENERTLRKGTPEQKRAAFARLANYYGVDVQSAASEPQQVQQYNPQIDELHTLHREISSLKQVQEQIVRKPFEDVANQFIADNPILQNPKLQAAMTLIIQNNQEDYANKPALEILNDAANKAFAMQGIAGRLSSNTKERSQQNVQRAKSLAVSPKNMSAPSKEISSEPEPASTREALERYIASLKG